VKCNIKIAYCTLVYLWQLTNGCNFRKIRGPNPGMGKNFSFSNTSRHVAGPKQPPVQGYWASFPGANRQGREVYKSHPSTSEVKKEWNFTSPPPTYLPGMVNDNSSYLILELSAQPWKIRMASALPTLQKNGKSDKSASPTYDSTKATERQYMRTSLEMCVK
jgi:hypothetical protein